MISSSLVVLTKFSSMYMFEPTLSPISCTRLLHCYRVNIGQKILDIRGLVVGGYPVPHQVELHYGVVNDANTEFQPS